MAAQAADLADLAAQAVDLAAQAVDLAEGVEVLDFPVLADPLRAKAPQEAKVLRVMEALPVEALPAVVDQMGDQNKAANTRLIRWL